VCFVLDRLDRLLERLARDALGKAVALGDVKHCEASQQPGDLLCLLALVIGHGLDQGLEEHHQLAMLALAASASLAWW
jgi:hypothetical protein